MEVAINNAQPFHREVRAWQRVDPNTGALLTGRMEADRWTSPSCNKFGVVDSQNISTPNGVQHTQRKQLEMLQARTSAGSLQVLRAKTVHTSSSRWSSSTSASTTTSSTAAKYVINDPTILQDHDPGNNAIEMNKTLSNPRLNNFKAHLQMQQSQQCQQQDQQQHQFAELMELMDKNQDYDNKSNSRKSTTSSGSSNNYHHTASRHSCSSGGSSTSSRDEDRKRLFKSNKIESYTNTKAQAPPRTLLPPMPMMMPTSSTTTTTSPSEIISRKSLYDVGVIEKQLDGSNERETIMNNSHSLYNRGKSVSNEDLTDQKQFDDDIEPIEWRRVSKIRRSLQYPKSSTQVTSYSRPPDLPENIGSVLKIKEELENGRRLSTAMLNNRVDFVALDNILNGDISKESDTTDKITAKKSSSKKTTYITAESLQEVRGKLRRLSDESLYKDDMAHETSSSSSSSTSSFGLVESRAAIKVEETIAKCDSQIVMTTTAKNNLREQRNRMLDKDWYLRRKSYGFEKMTANESSTSNHQSKMLESTDSGLGRSDELATSPTESPKGTVVSLSKNPSSTCITLSNGTHDIKQNQLVIYRSGDSSSPQDDEIKRHSIAVDEAKYVRDHLRPVFESARGTSIHLNGVYLDDKDDGRRLRRVEFCKTEIHFAAESGRVNIVATDEKPPPTNNFRRRRRTNSGSGLTTSKIGSSYLEAITSGVPVIHFGDTEVRPQSSTDQNTSTVNRSSEVTVSNEMVVSTVAEMPTSQKPDESDEDGDDVNIRGILKNKRAKPKPYLMGENIEGGSSLWGVKLRPVSNEGVSSWRHSSVITCENDVESIAGGGNLQNSGFSTKVHLASNDLLNTRPVKDTSPDHYVSLKEPTSMASVIQRRETENIKKDFSSSKIKIGLPQPTYLSQPTKLPSPKFQHSSKLENDLKSTSLIMRTIRLTDRNTISPPEILDVTKDVSRDSLNRGTVVTTTSQSSSPAMQLISQMNKIRRSSASNILSSSTSSSSFSLSSSRIRQLSTSIDSDNEFGAEETQRQKPIPAPRMKKIGPPNIVSHQLSQLRRMYAAADDSDDSAKADEEVKHYLGNLVMPTSNTEEKTSEKSKSWSRVKAKRTVKKQIINDDELSTSTTKATSSIIDNNQSNKMSIALHSPIEKKVIIAKSAPITEIITTTPKSSSTHIRSTIETSSIRTRNTNMTNELTEIERGSLKLTNGPRKLRDHELSYFGVRPKSDINSSSPSPPPALTSPSSSLRAPPQQHKTKTILISNSSTSANSSSTNKMHHASTTKHALINTNSSRPSPSSPSIINNHQTIKDRSKWQLSNDKPDLLRHNAPTSESYHNSSSTNNVISSLTKTTKTSTQSSSSSPTAKRQLGKTMDPMGTAEPIYENLRKPLDSGQSYKRHKDLERDVKILNEMSKDADQIMKSMKSSKKVEKSKATDKAQLTTIAENNSSQKTMRSKGVQVSQGSICPTHRRQRQSSASSTESVTRHSQVMQRIPSYSKRVEKVSSTDSAPRKRSSIIGRSKVTAARVSSRENLASHASSSEDLATNVEIVRRPRRTRNKEKSEEKTSTGKRQEILKPSVSRMSSGKSQQSANDAANKTTNKGSTSLEHRPKVRVKSGYLTTTSSTQKSTHASRSRNAEQTWK